MIHCSRPGFSVAATPSRIPRKSELIYDVGSANVASMDRLKQIESFAAVATKGSLTAAANAEGVAPAVIGRRIDALEERLGVKLLVRTTRRITLTHEGSAFLEDCQRLLAELANAEASVSAGGVKASGHLRITAPAGFGRRHVAPLVPKFLRAAPRRERVAEPVATASSTSSMKVSTAPCASATCPTRAWSACAWPTTAACAWPRRPTCKRAGTPRAPAELSRHECLMLSARTPARRAAGPSRSTARSSTCGPAAGSIAATARCCTTGALQGLGIAWRSTWEVEHEDRRRAAGRGARRVRRTAQRHLRGVSAAQAPAAARAAVDRLPQAQLRRTRRTGDRTDATPARRLPRHGPRCGPRTCSVAGDLGGVHRLEHCADAPEWRTSPAVLPLASAWHFVVRGSPRRRAVRRHFARVALALHGSRLARRQPFLSPSWSLWHRMAIVSAAARRRRIQGWQRASVAGTRLAHAHDVASRAQSDLLGGIALDACGAAGGRGTGTRDWRRALDARDSQDAPRVRQRFVRGMQAPHQHADERLVEQVARGRR